MVEETTDQADAVLDAWDKEHTERTPGMSRHVVPIAIEGSSVPIVGGLAREHHFLLNAALATGAPPDDESAGLDIDRIRPAGGWRAEEYGG